MPRRSRHWTDFPSELTDILEDFADHKEVKLGPLPLKVALNTRNEIYRFRTAVNTAIHARDDISTELMRLHDIARDIVIFVDDIGEHGGAAYVVVKRTALATAPRILGPEKLTEPTNEPAGKSYPDPFGEKDQFGGGIATPPK